MCPTTHAYESAKPPKCSWPYQETTLPWRVTITIIILTTELLAVLGRVIACLTIPLRTRFFQGLVHWSIDPGESRSSRLFQPNLSFWCWNRHGSTTGVNHRGPAIRRPDAIIVSGLCAGERLRPIPLSRGHSAALKNTTGHKT
jgi:hypothetical protein